jgi:hypothetical protein
MCVEDLVLHNLRSSDAQLSVFTEKGLVTALENFVRKGESDAIRGG